MGSVSALPALLCLLCSVPGVTGFHLLLRTGSTRCFVEEVGKLADMVTVHYAVGPKAVDLTWTVTDDAGSAVADEVTRESEGKFTYSADSGVTEKGAFGSYTMCVRAADDTRLRLVVDHSERHELMKAVSRNTDHSVGAAMQRAVSEVSVIKLRLKLEALLEEFEDVRTESKAMVVCAVPHDGTEANIPSCRQAQKTF
eukprot:Rhum_TRINITY_DN13120_c0_g1::Rhum_TRINITY_DN13120_c0_g1_i4::g.57212::m.57212